MGDGAGVCSADEHVALVNTTYMHRLCMNYSTVASTARPTAPQAASTTCALPLAQTTWLNFENSGILEHAEQCANMAACSVRCLTD
jgi:hypothetical protein